MAGGLVAACSARSVSSDDSLILSLPDNDISGIFSVLKLVLLEPDFLILIFWVSFLAEAGSGSVSGVFLLLSLATVSDRVPSALRTIGIDTSASLL